MRPTFRYFPLLVLLLLTGCGWTVHPPAYRADDAVPVFLADYGWHSSLLLPVGDDRYMEYVFGDWGYAAEGHTSPFDAFGALTASRQGTLGRRIIKIDLMHPHSENAGQIAKLVRIDISKARVDRLLKEMDIRYREGTESKFNPENGQLYVKTSERYSWTNSCNTMTRDNVEKLGCKVDGGAILSDFKVIEIPGVSSGTWMPPKMLTRVARSADSAEK
jgi:hypothetical protein